MKVKHFCRLWMMIGLLAGLGVLAGDGVLKTALDHQGRPADDLERDKTSKPIEVLTFFGVEPGMAVTDLFSGEGYYSEILAHAVGPKGHVIAHNNKGYLDFLKDKAKARYQSGRLPNVTLLDSEPEDLKLEANSQDMILMVLSYHDIYYVTDGWPIFDNQAFFAQLHRALKPDGILAIVDHAAEEGTKTESVQTLHRIDEAFAKADIMGHGFTFVASSDLLRNPQDDKSKDVFGPDIRRRSDRFIYKFQKPK